MQLTEEQSAAIAKAQGWLVDYRRDPQNTPQVFRFCGAAGTGKTTLAKLLSETCRAPQYAAPTGKAAAVLTAKGTPASTIHQLIYQPMDACHAQLRKLEAEEKRLLGVITDGAQKAAENARAALRELREAIREEKAMLERPFFALKSDSILEHSDLLCLDESSMVDEQVGRDLLSFGCPILAMGDPFQLPPVRGQGFFFAHGNDVCLTQVHRQALGSPILELATMVREGRGIPQGYDRQTELGWASLIVGRPDPDLVMEADQLLCGTNMKRQALNERVRELKGFTEKTPMEGDRLVCLKNNHELGLANGTIWHVQRCRPAGQQGKLVMDLRSDLGDREIDGVLVHEAPFLGRELQKWEYRDAEQFDFGYALTVHKAQGSQWDSVVLFDDWHRNDRRAWLYTGVTRAARELHVVQ